MLSWLHRKRSEPELSRDHSRDLTPDDFTRPQPTVISPATVLLSRLLEDLGPERRRVLAESETSNGWPARWRLFYEDEDDWPQFRDGCVAALDDFHTHGRPLELALNERGM
jgi:hypothetical protein